MLTEQEVEAIKPVRYPRKITDGAGLRLLETPKGTRRGGSTIDLPGGINPYP